MGFLRLFKRQKPKAKLELPAKDLFNGWVKCSGCEEMVHGEEMDKHHDCCPKCGHHHLLAVDKRIDQLVDVDSFSELFGDVVSQDPLNFVDSKPYPQRIQESQEKTGRSEGICVGSCRIEGREVALGVLDYRFMGGSMGSAVGERLTLLIEWAIEHHNPLVLVSASGGARMQESIFSLMQMAKTAAALGRLREAGVPYISILTHYTLGGVTASFASLGDINIAEPNAVIGFAGPRVVADTTGSALPKQVQRSEFLLEKGMVDVIVKRSELRATLLFFLNFLTQDDQDDEALAREESSRTLEQMVRLSNKQREQNRVDVS